MRSALKCFAFYAAATAVGVALITGCGGGGSGAGGGSGTEQTLQFGPLVSRVVGTAQPPVTASSSNSVASGIAGATVASLVFQDASPTLTESGIAFNRYDSSARRSSIYVMGVSAHTSGRISELTADDYMPAWSSDGTKLAVSRYDSSAGRYQIYLMSASGSSPTRISDGTSDDYWPSWSPDGTRIAFTRYDPSVRLYQIYVMTANGAGPARISDGSTQDSTPKWSPDGSKIAFRREDTSVWRYQIYVMDASGASLTRISDGTSVDQEPAWSPDGSKIAFRRYDTSIHHFQIYLMSAGGSNPTRISDATTDDYWPTWSPDGTQIAFQRFDAVVQHQQIYAMSTSGSNPTRLSDGTGEDTNPAWSPFVRSRNLIGAGGSMGTAAAGLIYAETGKALDSVLTFDTLSPTTRSSSRIAAQNGQNGDPTNLVFSITTADGLSSLAYLNGLFAAPTFAISPSGPPATGALVSLDSASGQVASVLPYAANRATGGGAPSFTREGGTLVYRGRFVGVWDGKGKNRAPNGASEVRIDAATGRLLGFS